MDVADQGQPRILRLDAIRSATLRREPFAWTTYDRALASAEIARELEATFPQDGFEAFVRESGAKRHRVASRAFIVQGQVLPRGLPRAWIDLGRELTSEAYRDAVAALSGERLEDLELEAALWRHGEGCFIDPHPDNDHKRVTHLLYFSGQGWTSCMGGALRILRSNDIDDVAAEILPTTGQSVVFVRSDRSWHGYKPIGGHGRERLALQIVFHRRGLAYSRPRAALCEGDGS